MTFPPYPCPCCGYQTLDSSPPGSYEICPICFWEDTSTDPYDYRTWNSNQVSLRDAQHNFSQFSVCELHWRDAVRPPTPQDKRNPNWQTIDAEAHQASLRVIQQIESAFAEVSREDGITLHEADVIDSYGSPAERLAAREKDTDTCWQDVPAEVIARLYCSLTYLDPIAWRYYIPAYLVWTLKNYTTSDSNSLDSTLYSLDLTLEDYDLPKFEALNLAQSQAVSQFLTFIFQYGDTFLQQTAHSALTQYWGKFAPNPTNIDKF